MGQGKAAAGILIGGVGLHGGLAVIAEGCEAFSASSSSPNAKAPGPEIVLGEADLAEIRNILRIEFAQGLALAMIRDSSRSRRLLALAKWAILARRPWISRRSDRTSVRFLSSTGSAFSYPKIPVQLSPPRQGFHLEAELTPACTGSPRSRGGKPDRRDARQRGRRRIARAFLAVFSFFRQACTGIGVRDLVAGPVIGRCKLAANRQRASGGSERHARPSWPPASNSERASAARPRSNVNVAKPDQRLDCASSTSPVVDFIRRHSRAPC